MFYAGLETNPFELKRMTRPSFFVAVGGFIFPFLSGYAVCDFLGLSHLQAMFIGMALSITAIAVNARVLTDMELTKYRVAPVIIGASIIDDILSLSKIEANRLEIHPVPFQIHQLVDQAAAPFYPKAQEKNLSCLP